MKFFKIIFWLLWRIWYYLLILGVIIILFPLLIVSIARESWYPFFFKLARIWAKTILLGMGFYKKVKGQYPMDANRSYMIIANHTSMIDIMLMLALVKNPFVFVGKQELAKIPLFGFFYKRTCILVDRNNAKSRQAVFEEAQRRLNQGLSICIFPEGLVPDDETIVLAPFKDGAFRLAIEHQIPIVPLIFFDNKKRFSYTFFSGSPGALRTSFMPIVETIGLTVENRKSLKDQLYQQMLKTLETNL